MQAASSSHWIQSEVTSQKHLRIRIQFIQIINGSSYISTATQNISYLKTYLHNLNIYIIQPLLHSSFIFGRFFNCLPYVSSCQDSNEDNIKNIGE